ncbi:hypothetical protein [Shinella kummerowiae]|uniref:hypothetical protein n=1 Tax=Shinella kummerowiae TaxID=417745 RepID=UPI0021B55A91|nr:hypothetical protein [Shinella kummerowiae]MCT7662358.1 hypothetical protein [Shinella kummerowiae]
MQQALNEQFDELAALRGKVTDEHLHESGRYFADGYTDLTQCHHGETGNYRNSADGKAVALLWNLWQAGALDELAQTGNVGAQPIRAIWIGGEGVLPSGSQVEILCSDANVLDVPARRACWVRFRPEGSEYFRYRSCDLGDLEEVSDGDFDAISNRSATAPVSASILAKMPYNGDTFTAPYGSTTDTSEGQR